MKIRPARSEDRDAMLEIWLRSVRATHAFLREEDIRIYLPMVRDHALVELEVWVLEAEDDALMGFMGLSGDKLEVLFLAPEHLRQGGGRLLVEHARKLKGPLRVDVNEQNPDALKFYEAMGFEIEGRSDLDHSGRPYPLLHLRENEAGNRIAGDPIEVH